MGQDYTHNLFCTYFLLEFFTHFSFYWYSKFDLNLNWIVVKFTFAFARYAIYLFFNSFVSAIKLKAFQFAFPSFASEKNVTRYFAKLSRFWINKKIPRFTLFIFTDKHLDAKDSAKLNNPTNIFKKNSNILYFIFND